MNDPIIAQFARACRARSPLDLQVDLAEGGVLAEGSIPMPFALVGRDDACDVTLTDGEVNPRHAWLQVIGGRVFAVDLGSRTGVGRPDGHTGSGWMTVADPIQVGPFRVRLRSPVSPRPSPFPADYNPLQSDPENLREWPAVSLEFRNGKRARDRWTVNRLVTLVGRAPECKIHLTADDISGHHCGLVLTPDGLWVVDLSARGVVVNGERLRVSPLPHGAELWVGRFLIGVHYHASAQGPPAGPPPARPAEVRLGNERKRQARDAVPEPAQVPEDEIPLGLESVADPDGGLSSSHIMADVFRGWTAVGGADSHPIAVAGSGRTAPLAVATISTGPSSPSPALMDLLAPPEPPPTPTPSDTGEAATLLRQLGDVHAQLFAQFQTSLVLMVRLFGCLRREELPAMQRELARIQELNAELAQLQGEVTRRAAEVVAPQFASSPKAGSRFTTPTPLPDQPPGPSADPTTLHDWVVGRINSLQRERQARWESLVGLFGGKPA